MRSQFLIVPYEDEDLYSWVSRHIKHSINLGFNDILEELTGQRRYSRRIRYLGQIENIARVLSVFGYNAEMIIDKMTYFNIVKPFYDETKTNIIKDSLLGSSERLYNRFSFHKAGMFSAEKFCYKVCPKCFEEDKEKYGEAYLHRNHNIIGIRTCYKHNCYLDIVNYIVNRKGHYYDVDSEYLPSKIKYPTDETIDLHNKFNKDIVYLIEGNMSFITSEIIRKKIKVKLAIMGITNRPFLNNDYLLRDFHSKYSDEFLNEYDLGSKIGNVDTWFRKCMYSDKVNENIFRQIITIRFLFGSLHEFVEFNEVFVPFGKGPYPCMNKICEGYHKKIINRYEGKFHRNRNCYVGTFKCDICGYTYTLSDKTYNENNIDESSRIKSPGELWLRKLEEYVEKGYSRNRIGELLNVSDHTIGDYLSKIGLSRSWYKKGEDNHFNQYWNEKDLEFYPKVKKVINDIKRNKEENRITIRYIAQKVGYSSMKRKGVIERMPKVRKLVEDSTETYAEYKIRIKQLVH